MAKLFTEIPFERDLDEISVFYELLGINAENGLVVFEKAEICYGSINDGIEKFQFVLSIDKALSLVEEMIEDKGGVLLEKGFDISGPFLIVNDPSGTRLRIEMNKVGLKAEMKKQG